MGKWDLKSLMTGLSYEDRLLISDQSQADGSQDRNVEVSELAAGFEREVSESSHGLSVGEAVRFDGTNYVEATADTSANAELLGIVSTVIDTDTFAYKSWGLITTTGLTAGDLYYLQDAGGLGTSAGTVSVPIGVATSTTELWLLPIGQGGGSGGGVSSMDDLSDVDTTTASPSVGDTLRWDGSNWVPTDLEVNTQTGTTYTLVAGDAQKLVTLDNASAVTVTIPTNASVAYPVGTTVAFAELGAGTVTITGDTGVTVNGSSGGSESISAQYGTAVATKLATDTWLVAGSLS